MITPLFIRLSRLALAMVTGLAAHAQLAITEVLTNPATGGVDFWELTNYGTRPVRLDDYWFADDSGFDVARRIGDLVAGVELAPGETAIFSESAAPPGPDFRAWWGGLPTELQIIYYQGYGLSRAGDALNLWQVADNETNRLFQILLPDLNDSPGVTLTVNTNTGALDELSVIGRQGARQAANSLDIGSPGTAPASVPIRIVRPPVSLEVDGGKPVRFSVEAVALPPPRFRWRFNGALLPGANEPELHLANVSPEDAGEYSVEVHNGVTTNLPPPVILTVNVTPSPAAIARGPADVECYPGLTPTFSVEVRGFPLPRIQWSHAGRELPGETNLTFVIPYAADSDAGLYAVRVSNVWGMAEAQATLTVSPKPLLILTEFMASPAPNPDTNSIQGKDWWELTNKDHRPINLRGYRFDDNALLEDSVTINKDIVLPPGASMIFVSTLTPDEFRAWWGEDNLPEDLIIFSYPGNGFQPSGESVTLWHPLATEDSPIFSTPITNPEVGVSLWVDPIEAEFGEPSVEGERGAFRSAQSADVGSPGWLSNDQVAVPRWGRISRVANEWQASWRVLSGRSYDLEFRQELGGIAPWTSLGRQVASSPLLRISDSKEPDRVSSYYRITLVPGSP